MHTPKISIIVPIYNAQDYLEECLSSIRTQTLKDIEVICVNDGSTDGSAEIIERFVKTDSRFKAIHKENTGYGHTMNTGLACAAGEYIGIVESDDWIPGEMMQTLYEAAEIYQVDFVKADFYRFVRQADGTIRKIYNHLAWDIRYYNRVLCPMDETESFRFIMNIWSGIYRRDFLKKNQISFHETPGASFQDNGFWFQTFVLAQRVVFLNKPLYMNRRDNPGSSVHCPSKVYVACKEYDYIRKWVKGLPGKHKGHEYLCSEGRIRNYLFTISRISDEYKEEFFIRFRKDYLDLLEQGEIAETLLPPAWKERIGRIVRDPKEACRLETEERNRFLRIIGGYKDLVIYGAGAYGKRAWLTLNRLDEKNRIAYFAVTEKAHNPSELFGVPVVELASLPEEFRKEALVIIAVKGELRLQMISNVREAGFLHYTDSMIFFE